jgi:hypothetical protein
MLHDMLQAMRSTRLRSLVAVFVALLLATGPALSALASAQAANPHAAMAMSDSGMDDGCCDHSDSDAATACIAHCAAGVIDVCFAFLPATAVSDPVAAVFVLPSASQAPTPDIAPPKSSAA